MTAPGLLANDTDPAGNPLTAVGFTQPLHDTLTADADGSLVDAPAAGYVGPDSDTYRASDGKALSAAATVSLTVAPFNLPPWPSPTPTPWPWARP